MKMYTIKLIFLENGKTSYWLIELFLENESIITKVNKV